MKYNRPKRELKYCRCAVICHGESEKIIARYIKSNLRLKIEIFSDNNGKKSIQINSLLKYLKQDRFNNAKRFAETYDIEFKDKKLNKFKLFIIMDTDDCSELEKNNYINKTMFKDLVLEEYIVPIYNINNLEDVLFKAAIIKEKIKDDDKVEQYSKIFKINSDNISFNACDIIENLKNKLEPIKNTNIDVFLKYCIDWAKECL